MEKVIGLSEKIELIRAVDELKSKIIAMGFSFEGERYDNYSLDTMNFGFTIRFKR